MLTDFVDMLAFFNCLYAAGYFFNREGVAGLFGKKFQNLALSLDDLAGGLLASFHSWLVIRIDVDKRSIKSHSPLEKGNQDADDKWRHFLNRDSNGFPAIFGQSLPGSK